MQLIANAVPPAFAQAKGRLVSPDDPAEALNALTPPKSRARRMTHRSIANTNASPREATRAAAMQDPQGTP